MSIKDKKHQKHARKAFIYIILGGFFIEVLRHFWHKRQLSKNFHKFINKEEDELERLAEHKEGYRAFCERSGKIFLDYFWPSKSNHHHPRILHTRSLAILVLVLTILKIVLAGYLFFVAPQAGKMSETMVNELLMMINKDRASEKLEPLTINTALSLSAHAKADDMVIKNYFAHQSPDGRKPWDFIDRNKYSYLLVGENLAMNFTSAQSAHTALMKSITHKKNILSDRYQDVGLAVVSGNINGQETNVLVELFASNHSTKTGIESKVVEAAAASAVGNESREKEVEVLSQTAAPDEEMPSFKEAIIAKLDAVDPGAQVEENTAKPILQAKQLEPVEKNKEGEANVSPNQAIANNPAAGITFVRPEASPEIAKAVDRAKLVQYIFLAIALLLVLILFIKFLSKMTIEHHRAIWETLLVIVFISGLVYLKLHMLEGGMPDIALI